MPNQRKKGKMFIGGYVPAAVANAFKDAAMARGLNVREALEQIIRESLEKKGDAKWTQTTK